MEQNQILITWFAFFQLTDVKIVVLYLRFVTYPLIIRNGFLFYLLVPSANVSEMFILNTWVFNLRVHYSVYFQNQGKEL